MATEKNLIVGNALAICFSSDALVVAIMENSMLDCPPHKKTSPKRTSFMDAFSPKIPDEVNVNS